MIDEFKEQAARCNPFELSPGMIVEVMTPENRLLFPGRVYTIFDGAVSIRELNDEKLPMALTDKPVKLGFFRERDKLVLRGKVCSSTLKMWKVDRLENAFTQEQRSYFRQSTGVNLSAQCGRPDQPACPCQVLDVSAGGMLISSAEEFKEGERLCVTDVPLSANELPFTFDCLIRRASIWKPGVFRYGCQFESLSPKDQDRLLRAIFAIQREEIRKRRGL